jgi:four helix bundle protein
VIVVVDFDGDGGVDLGVRSLTGSSIRTQPWARCADKPGMLSFQRLDVYQRAIEFIVLTTEVTESLPRGHAERADQLIRAAESVVRNIAEGAGRWSDADSAKHYKIARGEAMECAASLDVLKLRKLVAADRYDRGIQLLEGVVAMLTKMV